MTPLFRNVEVVGNYFRDDEAKTIYKDAHVGEEVELAHDDENEHDSFAVAVFLRDTHVGYIPATMSAAVFHLAATNDLTVGVTKIEKGKVLISVGLED